jgi:hypothetical protein
MWFIDHASLAAPIRETLQREVLRFGALQDVVRWAFSLEPSRDVAEVVVQDEFSHDVVIAWVDGIYLTFDTT